MNIRTVGLVLMLLTSCSSKVEEPLAVEEALNSEACPLPAETPMTIAISDAITDPKAFDGRLVSFEGYYCAAFEMNAIYETPDCYSEPELGLWLLGVSPFYSSKGRRVVVTGKFDSRLQGHLEKWPAGVCVAKLVEVNLK